MHLHRVRKRVKSFGGKSVDARGERSLRGGIRGEKHFVEFVELRFGILRGGGRSEHRLKLLRRVPCRAKLRVRIENLCEFWSRSNRQACRIHTAGISILRRAI